jgi:hypothetical protein
VAHDHQHRLSGRRSGLLTGVLLALARVSGETAPLLFTALNNQFWSANLNQPMANLPVVIFQFATSPYKNWQSLAWAGALADHAFRAVPECHRPFDLRACSVPATAESSKGLAIQPRRNNTLR